MPQGNVHHPSRYIHLHLVKRKNSTTPHQGSAPPNFIMCRKSAGIKCCPSSSYSITGNLFRNHQYPAHADAC
ncbi:hypothetical protein KCP78_24965 [Salmonella enterica subsp. enterica]|nr:hypothetical protein KCP78_24965 [Salmonella enterica subsp. enterica]